MSPIDGLLTVQDFERAATAAWDPAVADFVNAGAFDNRTRDRNRAAFDELVFVARRFVDVGLRSTATSVLGTRIDLPVMIAPTGLHTVAHADGELATARAAARAGTVMTTGTMATCSVEEVAAASGDAPRWLQVYNLGRDAIEHLVRRAEAADYSAIVLTVDVPVQLRGREHDRRNGFRASKGRPLANFDATRGTLPGTDPEAQRTWKRQPLRPVSLADLRWLRTATRLPVVVKGVMCADDAELAVSAGAAAVVVSNHGGREGDGLPASIEALPDVVAAVGSRAEVYLDGGVRRGSDVVKALALGARAVLIGRPFWWGLAVGGEAGVAQVLEILRLEIEETLIAIGCPDVRDLDARVLWRPLG